MVEEMTSPQFARAVRRDPLVVLPVGALEAHGPHLPLGADTLQPMAVAKALAKKRGALILPPLWYGYCWETSGHPGTVSIAMDTLMAVAEDLAEDLHRNGVRKLLVLSGHAGGGHRAALREGVTRVARRHDDLRAAVLSDYELAYDLLGQDGFPTRDGHAGFLETARVLAIAPRLVKGHTRVGGEWPDLQRHEVVGRPGEGWASGVWGAPRGATAAAGRRANAYVEERLLRIVDDVFA